MSLDLTCGSVTAVYCLPSVTEFLKTSLVGYHPHGTRTMIVSLFIVDVTARQNVAVADDVVQWSCAVLAVIIALPSAPSPTLIPWGDMSRPGAREPLARVGVPKRLLARNRSTTATDGQEERREGWVREILRRNSQQCVKRGGSAAYVNSYHRPDDSDCNGIRTTPPQGDPRHYPGLTLLIP